MAWISGIFGALCVTGELPGKNSPSLPPDYCTGKESFSASEVAVACPGTIAKPPNGYIVSDPQWIGYPTLPRNFGLETRIEFDLGKVESATLPATSQLPKGTPLTIRHHDKLNQLQINANGWTLMHTRECCVSQGMYQSEYHFRNERPE